MMIAALIRLLLLGSMVTCTHAINAMPYPINVTLPNGQQLTTKVKGGEVIAWVTDVNDYTILRGSDSFWYFAIRNSSGLLASSGVRADLSAPPSGVSKNILPTATAYQGTCTGSLCGSNSTFGNVFGNRNLREDEIQPNEQQHGRKLALKTGTVRNLLIPIRFADHTSRVLPTKDQLSILMNNNGSHATFCPTGSVRDIYKYNSYGKLDLVTTVADWVTVSGTEAYYANNNRGLTTLTHALIREALRLADPYVNFTQFDGDRDSYIDAIAFLHSGYGAEWGGTNYMQRIWSHKWQLSSSSGAYVTAENVKVYEYHISPALWGTSGSNIGHVGVIAHETGHFLGLPDLYDGTGGQGIGSFDLMGNSWGFTGNQYYPPHFSIYMRLQLGWDTVTTISTNGVYTLSAAQDQRPSFPRAYKITANFPSGEYLLIENRQRMYFDAMLPAAGLMIYHIDERATYTSEGYPNMTGYPKSHYKIAVLAPDGRYDLEKGNNRGDAGDIWVPGSRALSWSTSSSGIKPNSDAYQGGIVYKTYIQISNIAANGTLVSFRLQIGQTAPSPPVTQVPSKKPSARPSRKPSAKPSRKPSAKPSAKPSLKPSAKPSAKPAARPSVKPSSTPSRSPVVVAGGDVVTTTAKPSQKPSRSPSRSPSRKPVTRPPTRKPFQCYVIGSFCTAHSQCCTRKCVYNKKKKRNLCSN